MFVRNPASYTLFLYRSPFLPLRSLAPVSAPLSLTLFFLSSSFIRDYASRITYRSGADMLLPLRCKLLMKPQGARASTCKRKGRGSVERKDEYLS